MSLPSRILLATGNAHKIVEIRAILAGLLPRSTKLYSLDQIGLLPPPDAIESFATFTANARAKAEWCRDRSGLPCIADDSGICIDALDGRPGIHSARWAGPQASDDDRNARLLHELQNAGAQTAQQRRGSYACSAAYASVLTDDASETNKPLSTMASFGTMRGYVLPLTSAPPTSGAFGYDPIFFSMDLGMSVAKASVAEKNLYSHRARALRRLIAAVV